MMISVSSTKKTFRFVILELFIFNFYCKENFNLFILKFLHSNFKIKGKEDKIIEQFGELYETLCSIFGLDFYGVTCFCFICAHSWK